MKRRQQFLLLFLKGIVMGSADLVPGISGGTVAFVTGVYDRLLAAIQAFDLTALRLLLAGRWRSLWQHVDGTFLLPLAAGIGTSLLTTARLVTYLLAQYPTQAWSFVVGLVLGTAVLVYRQISTKSVGTWGCSLGGAALVYAVALAAPTATPHTSGWTVLAGACATCAMLLPGISGSLVLVLLGKYAFVLQALHDLRWGTLVLFALGGVGGLLTCARLIAWLLRTFRNYAMALLAGFMIGSLPSVWPWQQLAVAWILVGALVVGALERLAKHQK